jgi:N-acetyl-gamma-glutamyl-phosphate reductase
VHGCDVVFFCKRPGEVVARITELVELENNHKTDTKKLKYIDLSADFRLKDASLYTKWYGFEHSSQDLLKDAVYGLPELNADKIKKTYLIGNPGCYPTATILSLLPLISNNLLAGEPVFTDAYSGVSGAGRQPNDRNMAYNVEENILTYKAGTHQHVPEIEEVLNSVSQKQKIKMMFIPHVVPFKHGIMATSAVKIVKPLTSKQVLDLYKQFYTGKPFIRVLPENEYPEIRNVVNTNFCDIGIKTFDNYVITMSVLDNVVKGASGQAIQNLNLMFGYSETEGLLTLL